MKIKFLFPLLALSAMVACNHPAKENESASTEAEEQAKKSNEEQKAGVYFVNIKDGATVKSPVYVQMGVRGKDVEPAGELHEGKGHHHIIVDGEFTEQGTMVAKDETHIHYGKGQTSDSLKLSPGSHTLTLQFANGLHQSYGKDWSNTISIIVE
jgi:hypothetical protein